MLHIYIYIYTARHPNFCTEKSDQGDTVRQRCRSKSKVCADRVTMSLWWHYGGGYPSGTASSCDLDPHAMGLAPQALPELPIRTVSLRIPFVKSSKRSENKPPKCYYASVHSYADAHNSRTDAYKYGYTACARKQH